MRSLFLGSLLVTALGGLVLVGCGDDSGTGGTGAGTGAGTSDGGGGNPSEGGGGQPPVGDCVEIGSDDFDYLGAGLTGLFYGGTPSVALGGAGDDQIIMEVYDPETSGSIDLASGDNASYATCAQCLVIYEDLPAKGDPAKTYFQQSGSLELGATTPFYLQGSLEDVTLVEVTIDPDTFEATPVAGGSCLHITNIAIDVQPPVAGWTCDPTYYGDVAGCDCECGALDSDCADPKQDVLGCQEGQTCSATSECEGIPTGWTCVEADFDGGAGNGCDCVCGAYDPDCDLAGETLNGCQATDDTCNGAGLCVPTAWECDPNYFGDTFCDCECGAPDVDCDDPKATVFGCEKGEVCIAGECAPGDG